MVGYAESPAPELLPTNITVNCIAPAITQTDLLDEMVDEYIDDRRNRIPTQRLCSVTEIAGKTAWVASP